MTQALALSPDNKMTFTCPIFDAPTPVRSCVKLQNMVYMGKRPEVRLGCQACISASKCPIDHVVRAFAYNRATEEHDLSSVDPATGKLPAIILERVLPVAVMDHTLTVYRVSEPERVMIRSANERIEQQLATAPRSKGNSTRVRKSTQAPAPRKKIVDPPSVAPAVASTIKSAAESGDLSAAINT